MVLTGSRKADGTYARVTRVVAGTKRAARQAMAEMDIDLAKRPHDRRRVGSGVTVGQLLSRWLAHAETFEGRSPSTLREYRRVVAVELVPVLGSVKLYDLSVRHLETGTVRVDTSAFEEGGVRIEKSTKTRSVREVSLDRGTLARCEQHMQRHGRRGTRCRGCGSSQVHVFELLPGKA